MSGFRFYRRIRIFPGVYLNISKRGISFSFGVRGARITLGKTGTRATIGAPGTGLSWTKKVGSNVSKFKDITKKRFQFKSKTKKQTVNNNIDKYTG